LRGLGYCRRTFVAFNQGHKFSSLRRWWV